MMHLDFVPHIINFGALCEEYSTHGVLEEKAFGHPR